MKYVLVLNPGSTSTKVAIFADDTKLHETTIDHPLAELQKHASPEEQWPLRRDTVLQWIAELGFDAAQFDVIAARGGIVGQLESGAYRVNQQLVDASLQSSNPHASNLAAVIAYDLGEQWNIPSYIYDAVCGMGVPEPLYTYSGLRSLPRPFVTHVLNSRAVCFHHAKEQADEVREKTYLVTHLGGGITTNLVVRGKIIDFVGDDEGTFSPERSGRVPCRSLVNLCYNEKYTKKEMQTMLKGKGGLIDYLGTPDFRIVEKMAYQEQNELAREVIEAMVLQIAKDIGSMSTVVCGKVDAILLTGGLAHSDKLCQKIEERVSFLAPVHRYAGTFEMEALAQGILRVLNKQEIANEYHTQK